MESDGVDDGVPEPLQGQDKGAHELKRGQSAGVNDEVYAIGTGRDPSDEQRGEENGSALRACSSGVIHFVVSSSCRADHMAR